APASSGRRRGGAPPPCRARRWGIVQVRAMRSAGAKALKCRSGSERMNSSWSSSQADRSIARQSQGRAKDILGPRNGDARRQRPRLLAVGEDVAAVDRDRAFDQDSVEHAESGGPAFDRTCREGFRGTLGVAPHQLEDTEEGSV